MNRFLRTLAAAAALVASAALSRADAQGVTTGAITGTVTDDAGARVEGAQVEIRNPRTGLSIGSITRSTGLYTIQGLEPDAGYTITVRRIGYAPITRSVAITLGQTRREDFKLTPQAAVLSEVTVTGATSDPVFNATKTGTSSTFSTEMLERTPTVGRNFADFVSLVPQVSTTTGYLSGGGVNLRQNAIQIDGAQSGDVFGLGTTGQPGAQANAKSIPLDAVKEYQVLLSPFDVRQGGFGGLLINAVTKSGTNEFHGSVYANTRNQNLARSQPFLTDYSQQQFGGTLGGPILKDKLFFFGSAEFQKYQAPTAGSFIGAPDQFVSQATIDQLRNIMESKYGFSNIGGGEQVQRHNPNRNVFVRLDANLPLSTRLVLRHNYAGADNASFSRSYATTNNPRFTLSSNLYEFSTKTNSSVAEFLTNLSNGIYNELLLNYSTTKDFRTVPVQYPQITVNGIPRSDAATPTSFVFGTEASSQGNSLDQRTFEITDNFTIPVGAHSITLGTKNVFYKSVNLFAQNSMGSWTFANLDSLNSGGASNYQVSAPAPTDPYNGLATIRANTYAVYAQDNWTVTPKLLLSFGVRMEKPDFRNQPPENQSVFDNYGRHTSSVPSKAQWSPRFGFNWDVTGDQRNQLRGGIGSFSGGVPFVYLSNAFGNSGLSGFSSLTCNGTTTTNQAPIYSPENASNPPLRCDQVVGGVRTVGGGIALQGPSAGAAVNTIDPNFKYPKYLKGTLGFDHRFDNGLIATVEGLYTRAQQNAFYQNLALAGPTGALDRNGRVMYGTLSNTAASPVLKVPGGRSQVLDLTNSSGDYTWSVTGQLQKTFSEHFQGSAAYTYQQARDVASITSSTAGSNYRYQRSVSGRLDDMSVTRSKYDQPHKIVAAASYHFKTFTDVSVVYTGNSGAPYDYVYGTNGGSTGDLNADGQTQNDLVYVPKDAHDASEILFTGYNDPAQAATVAAMADAFENFISSVPCLNEARGTLMRRNACRNPWANQFDVSVIQSLGGFAGNRFRNLQVRLDVINFGNLLNKNWGRQAFSDQGSTCGQICSSTTLLTHTGSTNTGTPAAPSMQGIFRFDPTFKAYTWNNASSNYRMQLSMKYSF